MVQELIDQLADLENRQIFLKEQIRQAIQVAQIAMDQLSETDSDIFEMRTRIEMDIQNN